MERFGFIHDKLDIKILILFILRRLPDAIEAERLSELVLCDGSVGYFDYAECLSELSDTGHVEQNSEGYRITEKGVRNGSAIESSLPYTVRAKAEAALAPVAAAMRRSAMIKASHRETKGGCIVELSLEDTVGEMFFLRLLVPDAEMALNVEQNFRKSPESVYGKIIEMLS